MPPLYIAMRAPNRLLIGNQSGTPAPGVARAARVPSATYAQIEAEWNGMYEDY